MRLQPRGEPSKNASIKCSALVNVFLFQLFAGRERSIVRVADECMYYLLVERETSAFLLVDLCNVLSTGDVERWIFQHDGWRRKFCKLEA